MSIGSISFGSDGCIWEGSELKIVNCVELKSLSIGYWSFGRYNGFELSQLPQLKSIIVASDFSFQYVPNVVFRSMNDGRDGL